MRLPFSARKLLLPLVPAYRLALAWRELGLGSRLELVRRLHFPVISIGSLSAGGAGKTPLTIALAKALTQRGVRVDVLSRGYGRQGQRPARVRPDGSAEEFGDEPLLIALETGAPVYVAARRYEAGLLAEGEAPAGISSVNKPVVHLLDDGFQHRQLHRDVNILLLDGRDWFKDGLLPAGNLRETLQAARRATAIAIPAAGEDPRGAPDLEAALRAWGFAGPVWRLRRRMEVPVVDGPVVAFCGIARPEQFFAGLEAAGLPIATRIAFPDHHRYSPRDLDRLAAAARKTGAAALITTEKDQVRLGTLAAAFPESLSLKTAGLRVEIEDEDEAVEWVVERIASRWNHSPL
ncbi:MAG: tetraacyldisaccharide 4'-kinase [Terracidiphilus sp.]|jgi:tetraacyldisaccharide 4'-kinase